MELERLVVRRKERGARAFSVASRPGPGRPSARTGSVLTHEWVFGLRGCRFRDEWRICLVELIDANRKKRMMGKSWPLVGRTVIGKRTIAPSLLQFAHSSPPGCRSSQQCLTPLPSSPSPRCCPSCGGFEGAIESRSQVHPLVHLQRRRVEQDVR